MSTDQSPRRSDDPHRDTKDTHGDTNLPRRLPVGRGDRRPSESRATTTTATRGSSNSRQPSVFREPSGKACNSWELWEQRPRARQPVSDSTPTASPSSGPGSSHAPASSPAERSRTTRRWSTDASSSALAPVVTFNHFTAPHWFAMRGGLLDADAPHAFADYCTRVMEAFGDRHRLRRDAERAEPRTGCSVWVEPARLRARSRTGDARSGQRGGGRRALPRRQRRAARGLRRACRQGSPRRHRAAKAAIKAPAIRPPGWR